MPTRTLTVLSVLLVALLPGLQAPGSQTPMSSQSVAEPSPSPAQGPADSTKLVLIKSPQPVYPPAAETQELQGEVWIKLLISETGEVENTEIVSGNPILAEAAADAMKKWKFEPFIKNGHAVKVSTKLPFDFAMKNKVFDTPTKPAAQSSDSTGGGGASTPVSDGSNPPRMLRVSQGVMEGLLVHRVEPVYPLEARRNRIQGDVILVAWIGKDGRLHKVKAVSGPKELIEPSIGAVEQWRYRPYLLQGEPVEVETTIKIRFQM